MKIHAGYALRLGVSREELKEVVYLTTVTAGFPRAIDAAQALRGAGPGRALSYAVLRSRARSFTGDAPNRRLYSRLNCEGLS